MDSMENSQFPHLTIKDLPRASGRSARGLAIVSRALIRAMTYVYIMYVYMCVYIYIYIYIYTHTHLSLSLYIYIYIHTYLHSYPCPCPDKFHKLNTVPVCYQTMFLQTVLGMGMGMNVAAHASKNIT